MGIWKIKWPFWGIIDSLVKAQECCEWMMNILVGFTKAKSIGMCQCWEKSRLVNRHTYDFLWSKNTIQFRFKLSRASRLPSSFRKSATFCECGQRTFSAEIQSGALQTTFLHLKTCSGSLPDVVVFFRLSIQFFDEHEVELHHSDCDIPKSGYPRRNGCLSRNRFRSWSRRLRRRRARYWCNQSAQFHKVGKRTCADCLPGSNLERNCPKKRILRRFQLIGCPAGINPFPLPHLNRTQISSFKDLKSLEISENHPNLAKSKGGSTWNFSTGHFQNN